MLLPSILPSRKRKFLKKWQSSLLFLRQVMIPTLIVIFLELCEIWIEKKANLWVRVARNRNTLILNHKHDYVNYIIIIIFFKTFPHLNLFLSLLSFSIIISLTCTSANLQRSKIWRDFFQLALSVMFFSKTSFFFHCLYIVWSWSTFPFTTEQILNSRSKHKCKLWRRSTRWAFRNMWG